MPCFELTLYCILFWFQPRQCPLHIDIWFLLSDGCTPGAGLGWAGLFSGEEPLPRWHDAGGSFRMGCGWLWVGHAWCSLLKCLCKYSCSLLRSKKVWKSLGIKYPEAKNFSLCISNISHLSFLKLFHLPIWLFTLLYNILTINFHFMFSNILLGQSLIY